MFLWTTHVGPQHQSLLSDIKNTGFDGVEIPVFEGSTADFSATARMLDDIGLERTAVSAIGDPAQNLISSDPTHRRAGVDRVKWALDRANAVGANYLSGPLHSTLGHFSGVGPTDQEFDFSLEAQRQIGDHARDRDIIVGLEALNRFECYLVNTMDDLCAHIRDIDHPNIRAMYDTFHANIEEIDPAGALTRNKGEIVHIHISENDRGVPGRGNVGWHDFFAALQEIGYDNWLTIEAFGRGLPDLAAATKVWRDFAESPQSVYRDGYKHIIQGLG